MGKMELRVICFYKMEKMTVYFSLSRKNEAIFLTILQMSSPYF